MSKMRLKLTVQTSNSPPPPPLTHEMLLNYCRLVPSIIPEPLLSDVMVTAKSSPPLDYLVQNAHVLGGK